MKITRSKKTQKILTFFATNFDYREPYQILIDATFCQAALQHKVIVEEQLKRLLTHAKLLTTQCIILEAESLGGPLTGATMIVKKFFVHKCGHEGKPVSAAECIKLMTKQSRYIIASQDRALQDSLRRVPGRCLIYLHKATPVLEGPSEASKKYVLKKSKNLLSEQLEKRIDFMKKTQGIQTAPEPTTSTKKHKGRKNPNPLSCKKSKKTKNSETSSKHQKSGDGLSKQSVVIEKAKRKRIKLPAHIKEVIKSGANTS